MVLCKWQEAFEKLYTGSELSASDEEIKQSILDCPKVSAAQKSALETNKPLNYREVSEAIKQCKSCKACGIDHITNQLLKSEAMTKLLFCFFSKCFTTGKIPDCWHKSIINPIPKSAGYTTNPLEYRGLSLQSCVYKVFSNIINKRVMDHLESSACIAEEQNGFCKRRSCLHHIFTLLTLVRNPCQNGAIFATFIDFRKAFDSLDRDLLFHLLANSGVVG